MVEGSGLPRQVDQFADVLNTVAGHVNKTRVVALESYRDVRCGAVAMLGHNEICRTCTR